MHLVSTINTDFNEDTEGYDRFMRRLKWLPFANNQNIKAGDILVYSFFDDFDTFRRRTSKKYFFYRVEEKKVLESTPGYKYYGDIDSGLFLNATNIDNTQPLQFVHFSFYSSRVFRIIPKNQFDFFSQYTTHPEVFSDLSRPEALMPSIFL